MTNQTGIYPSGNRILVKPDPVDDGLETDLIAIPDAIKEKYGQAQSTGTLIAVGPDAFTHKVEQVHRNIDGELRLAEHRVTGYSEAFADCGDRVAFAKYGGLNVIGKDGETYRILNDEDVTARIDPEVNFNDLAVRKK